MSVKVISRGPGIDKVVRELKLSLARGDVIVGVQTSAGPEVATYAAANEFGTSQIPARPYIRPAIRRLQKSPLLGRVLGQSVRQGRLTDGGLHTLGWALQSMIKRNIESNTPPPNAPSTVRRKGHGRTLIDTGRLLNAIAYKIRRRG